MNRSLLVTCGLVACLFAAETLAQGRGGGGGGGGQGGCRGGSQSGSSGQSSGFNQLPSSFGQFANPYQQAAAQQASIQQGMQSVYQRQAAYQQQQSLKRQARRERQLAAIAKRKAEYAAKQTPGSINTSTRGQLAGP